METWNYSRAATAACQGWLDSVIWGDLAYVVPKGLRGAGNEAPLNPATVGQGILNGVSGELKRRGVGSDWPSSCQLKEYGNRLPEEGRDRDEMDPILLVTIGAAILS